MQQQFKYIQCNFVLKPTQIKSEPLRILDFDKAAAWIGRALSLVGPQWNFSTNKQCLIDPISRIDWNWKLFWLHCWWWWCQSLSSTGELCLGLQGIFTMTMMEGITVMLVMLPDTLAAACFLNEFSKTKSQLGRFTCSLNDFQPSTPPYEEAKDQYLPNLQPPPTSWP